MNSKPLQITGMTALQMKLNQRKTVRLTENGVLPRLDKHLPAYLPSVVTWCDISFFPGTCTVTQRKKQHKRYLFLPYVRI